MFIGSLEKMSLSKGTALGAKLDGLTLRSHLTHLEKDAGGFTVEEDVEVLMMPAVDMLLLLC